jgi:hypothetical protein
LQFKIRVIPDTAADYSIGIRGGKKGSAVKINYAVPIWTMQRRPGVSQATLPEITVLIESGVSKSGVKYL